jgi:hypothetical protein
VKLRLGPFLLLIIAAAAATVGWAPAADAADGYNRRQFRRFEARTVEEVNRFWADRFDAAGEPYASAGYALTEDGEVVESACGAHSGDPDEFPDDDVVPAFYCPADSGLYLSSSWMYRQAYLRHGDFAAAVIVAHEMGHHVQAQLGIRPRSGGGVRELELQADCFAGVWGRSIADDGRLEEGAIEEALAALYEAGDYEVDNPQHHGTPKERDDWFRTGFETGNPGACQPE